MDNEVKIDSEIIQEMARIGDMMYEILEGLETHPVIRAFLEYDWDSRIFLTNPGYTDSSELREEWDIYIGLLQEKGLVGPFGDSEPDVYTYKEA